MHPITHNKKIKFLVDTPNNHKTIPESQNSNVGDEEALKIASLQNFLVNIILFKQSKLRSDY
jgi:hypothetical protein